MRTVADIQHEIERLTRERDETMAHEKGPWPRYTVVHVLGYLTTEAEEIQNKLYNIGIYLGLSKKAAHNTFEDTLNDLRIKLEVQRDGTAKIVEVNGVVL